MSTSLLAYIFVNFHTHLPHTSRCYSHSASNEKRFVGSTHQIERIRPPVWEGGKAMMHLIFDECSNRVQSSSDLRI